MLMSVDYKLIFTWLQGMCLRCSRSRGN